ncbi:hypothetical protein EVAR_47086_1 [Eumeta japonica]|uniref:Mariner Mos1 transposase n=1 Tax=Eumeta variegata TaxID=151549 RepID=A0A4C1Y9B2_EUMVA|nr:hypothetical protein EVAR_47086_1 [Eumeta japonica]
MDTSDFTKAQKLICINGCCEVMQRFAGDDLNTVHDMITDDESWIYCYDIEISKIALPCKRKLKRGKKMVTSFSERIGYHLEDKKKNRFYFIDNTSPHTVRQITNNLEKLSIEILAYPSCSPDLAP